MPNTNSDIRTTYLTRNGETFVFRYRLSRLGDLHRALALLVLNQSSPFCISDASRVWRSLPRGAVAAWIQDPSQPKQPRGVGVDGINRITRGDCEGAK